MTTWLSSLVTAWSMLCSFLGNVAAPWVAMMGLNNLVVDDLWECSDFRRIWYGWLNSGEGEGLVTRE